MKTQHTPGPWHQINVGAGRISISQVGGAQTNVCDLNPAAYYDGDEFALNARLIAGAPDLFVALENLVDDWTRIYGALPSDHEATAILAAIKNTQPPTQ
jgi:hypothetical protein